MKQDIDLLSLSKNVDSSNNSTNVKDKGTKKEGISLFDSLVIKNQKEVEAKTSNKDDNQETTKKTVLKDADSEIKDKSNSKKEVNTKTINLDQSKDKLETKTSIKKELEESKNSESKKITEPQESIIRKQTPNSLLDRIILESKKDVKIISSEEKDLLANSNLNNKKDDVKTVEENKNKPSSLLDKLIAESKTMLKEDAKDTKTENKTENKQENTKQNKTENKTEKKKEKKTEDKLENKNKNKTENKLENTNQNKTENKTENKLENTNQNKTENIAKNEAENKVENKVETTSQNKAENISQNKTENKVETTRQKKTQNKVETTIKNETQSILNTQINNIDEDSNKENKLLATKDIKKDLTSIDNEKNSKVETKIDNTKEVVNEKLSEKSLDTKQGNINISGKNNIANESNEITKDNKELKQNNSNISNELKTNLNAIDKKNNITKEETQVTQDNKLDNSLNKDQVSKIKNEFVADEFSKLNTNNSKSPEPKIDINKKDLLSSSNDDLSEKNTNKEQTSKSLMDRLLDKSKDTITVSKNSVLNDNLQTQANNTKSNDVVTNIFLSNQKNSIYNQMLSTKSEGLKVVNEGKNIEDIKKSAKVLDLGLNKASVDVEQQNDNIKAKNSKDNDSFLDKLAFNKNIRRDIDLSLSSAKSNNSVQNTISSASTSSNDEVIANVSVSPSLALSIQNRIIGAQQQMASMMSDTARNMYQNYKPPVTAFRINLFPSQLGSIAILMKNDKENGISISMNMSNSNTLEAFVDNQNTLKDALNKNFNNNQTTFTLDFNMQDRNQDQSSNKQEENNKNKNENVSSTDVLESINDNKDVGENLNYL